LKILVGSPVSLEEFETIDLFISWLDVIPDNARFSIVGTSKFFIIGKNGREWKKGYEFGIVDADINIFVVGGDLALYPEVFYICKGKVLGTHAGNISGLHSLVEFPGKGSQQYLLSSRKNKKPNGGRGRGSSSRFSGVEKEFLLFGGSRRCLRTFSGRW